MTALSIICVVLLFGTIGTALGKACLGCPTDLDPNDTSDRNLLTKVVESQNAKSDGEGITFTSIDKVTSQIVSGIKYSYDFHGEGKNTKRPYTCHSVIVNQPWVIPEPQVLEYKCTLE